MENQEVKVLFTPKWIWILKMYTVLKHLLKYELRGFLAAELQLFFSVLQ